MIKRHKILWTTLLLLTFVSLALAACGGATGTAVGKDAAESATVNVPQALPAVLASETEPPAEGPGTESAPVVASLNAGAMVAGQPTTSGADAGPASVIASLDTQAIVAAHEEVISNIYESVLPSVVRIEVAREVTQRQQPNPRSQLPPGFERFFESPGVPEGFVRRGEGSGFVWSEEGYVVTNHHVIAGAARLTVVFADGSEFEAEVLGSDPDSDLAVLKIEVPADGLKAVSIGDSDQLRVGQLALAIGNPFGQEFTMTRGIVSALGRAIQSGTGGFANPEVIQTDAPINPGNSGGPLLDRHGNVIGINSQIISNSGANAGVGFAVPINTARRVVPELIASGTYEYAYIGITGQSLRPDLAEANGLPENTRGVLVVRVAEGGPAQNAGILGSSRSKQLEGVEHPIGGDVITGIDGTRVEGITDLIAYLVENNKPGDHVRLDVLREGREQERVEITLSPRPGPTTTQQKG